MTEIKGIRFCLVSDEAEEIASCLSEGAQFWDDNSDGHSSGFGGAKFQAGSSRIEVWPSCEEMKPVTMLQIIVEDAEKWAEAAQKAGAEIYGPMRAHGETIYSLKVPGGLVVSVQSED